MRRYEYKSSARAVGGRFSTKARPAQLWALRALC